MYVKRYPFLVGPILQIIFGCEEAKFKFCRCKSAVRSNYLGCKYWSVNRGLEQVHTFFPSFVDLLLKASSRVSLLFNHTSLLQVLELKYWGKDRGLQQVLGFVKYWVLFARTFVSRPTATVPRSAACGGSDTMDKWPLLPDYGRRPKQKLTNCGQNLKRTFSQLCTNLKIYIFFWVGL